MGRSKSSAPKRNISQTQEVLYNGEPNNAPGTTDNLEEQKEEECLVAQASLIERSDRPIHAESNVAEQDSVMGGSDEEEKESSKKKRKSDSTTIAETITIPIEATATPTTPLQDEIQIKKCKRKGATTLFRIFPLSNESSDVLNNQVVCGDEHWVLYKSSLRGTQLEDGTKPVSPKKSAQNPIRYWVRSSQGVVAVMSNINKQNSGKKRVKPCENDKWKLLGEAVEQKLLDMFLVQDTAAADGSGLNVTSITLSLSENSLHICSPSSIGWNAPLQETYKSKKKITTNKAQAILIQEVLKIIFSDSLLSDCIHSSSFKDSTSSNSDDPPNDIITAGMLYKAIDNANLLNEQEKEHPRVVDEESSESTSSQGLKETKTDLTKIPGLVPTLRKYQEAAVKWMLHREKEMECSFPENKAWEICWLILCTHDKSPEEGILPLYGSEQSKLSESAGNTILYNPFTGWLSKSYDTARAYSHGYTDPCDLAELCKKQSTGGTGILAEMMGLGKTVEVLACILANPCPSEIIAASAMNVTEQKHEDNESAVEDHEACDNICYCGRKGSNKHALSWVYCNECFEPMHGRCAGFKTKKSLSLSTHSRCLKDKREIRICDAKRCPSCSNQKHTSDGESLMYINSRATLIITPPSIMGQWEREIARHTAIEQKNGRDVAPLRVAIYPGVKELCKLPFSDKTRDKERRLINAHNLANADVVLTTFQVLMCELGHSAHNPFATSATKTTSRSNLRRKKKYRVLASPLTGIKWWRVVLDEAQRIETPTAASATMARMLQSNHKWAVSGTPIGKGKIEDLYGLFLFLDVYPFNDKRWFTNYMKASYRDIIPRMKHFFQDIIWRSTKDNLSVRSQMNIPDQIEKKVFLNFSSIERHFYQRQFEETILAADGVISCNKEGRRIKNKSLESLSLHLHRLRAACCHPQVGSSGIARSKKRDRNDRGTSIGAGVLTMSQILDRLVDDAKTKAEEALRVFTLHSNALANLKKLHAEINLEREDELLYESFRLYSEALNAGDKYAFPTTVIGESVLSGSAGFQSAREVVRDGTALLSWNFRQFEKSIDDNEKYPEVWSRVDFTGPSKKILSLSARAQTSIVLSTSDDKVESSTQCNLFPKDCVLQVSNAAIGGMFVDMIPFSLPKPETGRNSNDPEWNKFHGIRPNKSKSWRVVVKNYHEDEYSTDTDSFVVGIDVQLMEPDISFDNLQRLHILHNACLVLTTLKQKVESDKSGATANQCLDDGLHKDITVNKINNMQEEAKNLEEMYVSAARALHEVSHERFKESSKKRKDLHSELILSSNDKRTLNSSTEYTSWFDDVLAWCHINNDSSLCQHVKRCIFDLFNDPSNTFNRRSFPEFDNIDGLNFAIGLRTSESSFLSTVDVPDCIEEINQLNSHPSEFQIYENSHCRKCRSDWMQTGPICKLCKVEKKLNEYQEELIEPEINCVLTAISDWLKTQSSNTSILVAKRNNLTAFYERSKTFFELKAAALNEISSAKAKWRIHFDLLSDIDELNQCKRSMRLALESDTLFQMNTQEAAFIVQPYDIPTLRMDHSNKQAMAEASLRRSRETLRFLKNQNIERKLVEDDSGDENKTTCMICLAPFYGEKAVLQCGHFFHYSPCLEQLMARGGGGSTITCPLRCHLRTKKEDILLASDISKDDGSKTARKILGTWGTKIDRLVSDLLNVIDMGEKSIIFSQWDDMLDIMEEALRTNNIQYVRAKSPKMFGACTHQFRSTQCPVLLLHVKHGAEGLTLVEANHVFIIEPLLNYSMDSQAINRVHRIGQRSKTYVHRYIIQNTIEVKIDKLRMKKQDESFAKGEDGISTKSKNQGMLGGGGLDGGCNEAELQELLE